MMFQERELENEKFIIYRGIGYITIFAKQLKKRTIEEEANETKRAKRTDHKNGTVSAYPIPSNEN